MNDAIYKMLERYKITNQADTERALREILQEITLIGLWRSKFFDHAAFYGGTALRILYGLDRFSEDLDFTLLNNQSFTWNMFANQVVQELSCYGFEVNFSEKKKQIPTSVQSAFHKTNTKHALLQISQSKSLTSKHNPDALIRIKIEIDTCPTLGFNTTSTYLRDPLPIPIRTLHESSLFACKTHATLYRAWKQRIKGGDWYDLIWFLRRGTPLHVKYLEACMHASGTLEKHELLTILTIKNLLKNRLQQINLDAAKEDIRPFLRDPTQLDLWSIDFFTYWIDRLQSTQDS